MRNTTNEETNIEEGKGDSEEDAIPDFIHNVSNMVGGSNVVNSSSNHISAKRKGTHHTTPQCRKKKKGTGMRAQLFTCLDQLVKSVSIAKESTIVFRNKKGCNIEEVMEDLHSIDGVNFDNTLHTFTIEFFCARSKR